MRLNQYIPAINLFTATLALILAIFMPAQVFAYTYTVTSTNDTTDSDLNDGLCNDGSGNCTLRAAIQHQAQML